MGFRSDLKDINILFEYKGNFGLDILLLAWVGGQVMITCFYLVRFSFCRFGHRLCLSEN